MTHAWPANITYISVPLWILVLHDIVCLLPSKRSALVWGNYSCVVSHFAPVCMYLRTCMYVCQSLLGMLIMCVWWACTIAFPVGAYCCHAQGDAACSSKSLRLSTSTSVSEASENHGTKAMDTRGRTAKPEEDRYVRERYTVSDAPEAETGSK